MRKYLVWNPHHGLMPLGILSTNSSSQSLSCPFLPPGILTFCACSFPGDPKLASLFICHPDPNQSLIRDPFMAPHLQIPALLDSAPAMLPSPAFSPFTLSRSLPLPQGQADPLLRYRSGSWWPLGPSVSPPLTCFQITFVCPKVFQVY